MLQRILFLIVCLLFSATSFVHSAVEIDNDDNGAVDVSKGGTNATTAVNARTNLGLVIGTDVLAPTGDGSGLSGVAHEDTDTLAGLSCSSTQVAKWNGSAWACADDTDSVTSVNSASGAVTLDADDIDDTATTNKFVTDAEKSAWDAKSDFDGAYSSLSGTPTLGTAADNAEGDFDAAGTATSVMSSHTSSHPAPTNRDTRNQIAGSYLTSETSHADVLVDGDFTSNGFMKRTGAGTYTVDTGTYDASGTASGLMSTHTSTHPAPTNRDTRNQVAGSYLTSESQTAADIAVTTTAFGVNFSNDANHNTVQKLMDKIDDFALSGYTNLTSFVSQTPWRLFYSNTDGDVTELAFGADGTYLMSNGASVAPSFETPSGAPHDAVTLATGVNALTLSTQEIGVDSTVEELADLTPSNNALLGFNATGNLANKTVGIADTNITRIDQADVATSDYAKFTANGLSGRSYSEVRSDLGLVIGTNVQAYDADLGTYAGITPSANIQTLLGSADYAAVRTNLGLVVGTNVQAYSSYLGTIASLARTDSNFIVGNGTTWVAESGATVRTSLGLTIGTNVQAYDADLTTWAGVTSSANGRSLVSAADYAAMKGLLDVDDLITLSGVAAGAANLGTFTGTTIADSVTIKAALQALESSVEGKTSFDGAYSSLSGLPTLGTAADNAEGDFDAAGTATSVMSSHTSAHPAPTNRDTRNQIAGSYLTSETSHADVVVDGDFTSDGFLKRSGGTGSYTVDTNTYLTSETSHADVLVDGDIGSTVQAYSSTMDTDYTDDFDGAYSSLSGAPSIPGALADLSADSTHRTVTDTEKSTWNAKSDFDGAYSSLSGTPTLGTAAAQDVGYFDTAGTATSVMSSHTSSHPAPTDRDTRNQVAGSYAAALGADDNYVTDVEKAALGKTITITLTATAANSFTVGQCGYVAAAGTVTKCDADAEISTKSMVVIASGSISGGASGLWLVAGSLTSSSHGFTVGLPLYISGTAGDLTTTTPGSGFVRVVGYAVDANTLYIVPNTTWGEI